MAAAPGSPAAEEEADRVLRTAKGKARSKPGAGGVPVTPEFRHRSRTPDGEADARWKAAGAAAPAPSAEAGGCVPWGAAGGGGAGGPKRVAPSAVFEVEDLPRVVRQRTVSRRLCAVLRHDGNFKRLALERDAMGFVRINHVAVEISIHPERILQVAETDVKADGKPRFEVLTEAEVVFIRATDKHSIEVISEAGARKAEAKDSKSKRKAKKPDGERLCRHWTGKKGSCRFGAKCRFLHDASLSGWSGADASGGAWNSWGSGGGSRRGGAEPAPVQERSSVTIEELEEGAEGEKAPSGEEIPREMRRRRADTASTEP